MLSLQQVKDFEVSTGLIVKNIKKGEQAENPDLILTVEEPFARLLD